MPEDSKWQRLHAVISGRVQGVNFRAYTHSKATMLKLTGWVRNRSNGTVETVAEGEEEALLQFLDFLHTGSPLSRVSSVDNVWETATKEFSDFEVRYF